jgi:hypothetical protein
VRRARLLAHMRRWVRRGVVTSHFVEWQGARIKSWLMQHGVPIWQAAGYLGMSPQMIERTYGHHHPDYMRGAAQAITAKQPANVSLVVSLVEPKIDRREARKPKYFVVGPGGLEPPTKRL